MIAPWKIAEIECNCSHLSTVFFVEVLGQGLMAVTYQSEPLSGMRGLRMDPFSGGIQRLPLYVKPHDATLRSDRLSKEQSIVTVPYSRVDGKVTSSEASPYEHVGSIQDRRNRHVDYAGTPVH